MNKLPANIVELSRRIGERADAQKIEELIREAAEMVNGWPEDGKACDRMQLLTEAIVAAARR